MPESSLVHYYASGPGQDMLWTTACGERIGFTEAAFHMARDKTNVTCPQCRDMIAAEESLSTAKDPSRPQTY